MNNSEPINICYSCDENYARYMAISMLSIERYTTSPLHFYVLHSDITQETQKTIEHTLKYPITFIHIDIAEFSNVSTRLSSTALLNYPEITLFRLSIAKYLSMLEKVIYIDVDTIITNDITLLWNTNLQGKSIGAIYEHYLNIIRNTYKSQVGIPINHYYFNSEVLLLNIDKFRDKFSIEKIESYLKKYKDFIEFPDQDILNYLFSDDVYYLNPRFNFIYTSINILKHIPKSKLKAEHNILEPIYPKIITHFAGTQKSWHLESLKKESFLYDYLYRHSPWKNIQLKSRKNRSTIGLLWYKIRRYILSYTYHFYFYFNLDKVQNKKMISIKTLFKKVFLLPFSYKKKVKNFDFRKINSILIRPTGNALGDSVINSAYVQQLKTIYPHARIGMLVTRNNRTIYELNPCLDELIEQNFLSFIKQRKRWDIFLDMPDAFNSIKIILDKILSPKVTIIFDKKYKPFLNTDEIKNFDYQTTGLEKVHNIDFIKQSIFSHYFPIPDGKCSLPIDQLQDSEIERLWITGKIKVLLAPQGSRRLVPADEIAKLLNNLNSSITTKLDIMLNIGGDIAQQYLDSLNHSLTNGLVIRHIPQMSLKKYLSLVQSSDLVIGVDSGTVHLACAMDKPLLSFYANYEPNLIRWSPKPNYANGGGVYC